MSDLPTLECGCCFGDARADDLAQCTEGHVFCSDCFRRLAADAIGNDNYEVMRCVDQSGCKAEFPQEQRRHFLDASTVQTLDKLEALARIQEAASSQLKSCSFCGEARLVDEDQTLFACPNTKCRKETCIACEKESHGNMTCEEAVSKMEGTVHRVAELMTDALVRTCPGCKARFMKEYGCNKITCHKCKTISCYLCKAKIRGYEHFSEAGCPLYDKTNNRHDIEVEQARRRAIVAEEAAQAKSFAPELFKFGEKAQLVAPPQPPAPQQHALRAPAQPAQPPAPFMPQTMHPVPVRHVPPPVQQRPTQPNAHEIRRAHELVRLRIEREDIAARERQMQAGSIARPAAQHLHSNAGVPKIQDRGTASLRKQSEHAGCLQSTVQAKDAAIAQIAGPVRPMKNHPQRERPQSAHNKARSLTGSSRVANTVKPVKALHEMPASVLQPQKRLQNTAANRDCILIDDPLDMMTLPVKHVFSKRRHHTALGNMLADTPNLNVGTDIISVKDDTGLKIHHVPSRERKRGKWYARGGPTIDANSESRAGGGKVYVEQTSPVPAASPSRLGIVISSPLAPKPSPGVIYTIEDEQENRLQKTKHARSKHRPHRSERPPHLQPSSKLADCLAESRNPVQTLALAHKAMQPLERRPISSGSENVARLHYPSSP